MKTNNDNANQHSERQAQAYDRLLGRMADSLRNAENHSSETLAQTMQIAKQKAIHLGELTHEEAQQIEAFVSRDLYSLGHYLSTGGHEVADWLRLETLLLEKEALASLSHLADQLRIDFKHLKKTAVKLDEWQTGETTGIGTLQCQHCDQLIHFHKTGRIPPCPTCKNTTFQRVKE